ncbi:hypothetical protein [Pseudomonas helleri]|uniref:hypothetical protein n=1 Tax=Pseudomonas helleri TaxID=1608996 RepID=UPI003FD21D88
MEAANRACACICLAIALLVLTGCAATSDALTHIRDLQACQPAPKNPELFKDSGGWDHRGVDDVRCSNAQLKVVKAARQLREAAL